MPQTSILPANTYYPCDLDETDKKCCGGRGGGGEVCMYTKTQLYNPGNELEDQSSVLVSLTS